MFNRRVFSSLFPVPIVFAICVASVAAVYAQDSRPRYSSAQYGRSWTVPEGTVISMRMDSNLNSKTSRAGDKLTGTVTIPVYVEGKPVILAGSVVEGHVTLVTPAKRPSKSGTIAVDFDELVFPNGSRVKINGTLTAADPQDRQRIDDESRVSGDTGNRSVVFIGGGGAIGAVLGGIAGGGKGAVLGGIAGAGAGIAGVLLSKGVEAEVRTGTPFGIQLTQPLVIRDSFISESTRPADTRDNYPADARPEVNRPRPSLPLSSPEMIRRAQTALKEQGYYEGQADGIMGPRTTTALKAYQREHNLAETGRLDPDTARALGISGATDGAEPAKEAVSEGTREVSSADTVPADVVNATAKRTAGGGVYVLVQTQANTGGWRWLGEHRVEGDILNVYARGVRPTGIVTQVLTRGKIELNIQDGVENVSRVVVHGARGDVSIPLGNSADPATPNRIKRQADDLLSDYRRTLGIRVVGNGVELGARSKYDDAEIALLFALGSFVNAANLYSSLSPSLADPETLRSATVVLAREARRADRVFSTADSQTVQSLTPRWDALRQDVLTLMESQNIRASEIEN